METKVCTKCGEEKSLAGFYKNPGMADGYVYKCKECLKKLRRDYYKNNREKLLKRVKEWQRENPEKHKFSDAYIISLIKQSSNMSREEIRKHPALIELKRNHLKLKREFDKIIK